MYLKPLDGGRRFEQRLPHGRIGDADARVDAIRPRERRRRDRYRTAVVADLESARPPAFAASSPSRERTLPSLLVPSAVCGSSRGDSITDMRSPVRSAVKPLGSAVQISDWRAIRAASSANASQYVGPQLRRGYEIDEPGIGLAAAELASALDRHLGAEHQDLDLDGERGFAVSDAMTAFLEVAELQKEGQRHRHEREHRQLAIDADIARELDGALVWR